MGGGGFAGGNQGSGGAAIGERRLLLEPEAYVLLSQYGIETPPWRFVTEAQEAAAAADEVGYPVVVKAVSRDIVHKSDVGAVRVGIGSGKDAIRACHEIAAAVAEQRPQARLEGWLVAGQVLGGVEVVAGMVQDAVFGPVLMFGSGGVLVEILRDVAFRAVPISERDAREMIADTRASRLLEGVRGRPPANKNAVIELLLGLSRLVEDHPEIAEIDLNPVLVTTSRVVAVDARIISGSGGWNCCYSMSGTQEDFRSPT